MEARRRSVQPQFRHKKARVRQVSALIDISLYWNGGLALDKCTTFCTLRCKDVVNVVDGARLGYVYDIEVNVTNGCLSAIILPGRLKAFGLLGREDDIYIRWECIRKIGEDTILVEYASPVQRDRRKKWKW